MPLAFTRPEATFPSAQSPSPLANARPSTSVPPSALAACGVAAIVLAAALAANSVARLPLGLDRCYGLIVGLVLAVVLTTLIWPELSVPAILIGAVVLDFQLGGERVRHLVFVKLSLFACGGIGVAFANMKCRTRFVRVQTPGDAPALCLVLYTAASAAYGYFVGGYALDSVAVAGYHLGQLALYHFLVTTTLCRPAYLRRASTIVVLWSLVWIIPSLLTPGRGGGTASMWLIVLLCYATASRSWWAPAAWAALPFALLDTLTSGYRTLWISVAAQLGCLATWGFKARLRRLALAAGVVLVLGVFTAPLLIAQPSLLASVPAAATLNRFSASFTSGGYRIPEAVVGLEVFRQSPVFGSGVGYRTPPVWIETMGYMPTGPIHHLYYVSYLANEGILGLALVLWYFLAVLFSREARCLRRQASANPWAAFGVGLQAGLFGAIVAAFFSGPSDGHWTWGVLGAGSLLPAVWIARRMMDSDPDALQRQLTVRRPPPRDLHGSVSASYGTG